MRFLNFLMFLFGSTIIFSSCSDKQYQTLFEKRELLDSATKKKAVTLDSYLIQSQDILQIRNLQHISYIVDDANYTVNPITPTANSSTGQGQTYQVEEDGTVALPDLGHVLVVGLTRGRAQKKIEQLYIDSGIKKPIIELKIINLKVTILGEVRAQGNYPLTKDKTTLIELIGEAGGLTDKANGTNIKIIRGNQSSPQVLMADLNDVSTINNPANILQNGDIIYVAENKRAAQNDNLQNFSTIFSPVLLVLNTALIIFTLAKK